MTDSNHNKIMFLLGEIKGEMKGIKNQLTKLNSRVDSHSKHINKVELLMAKFGGIVLIVTGALAFMWSLVASWVRMKIGL